MATALTRLLSQPAIPLAPHATPVDDLVRLRAAIGPACPRLLMKRDDLLSFAMGGNKVRKMETVAAQAVAAGADVLITCGGVQSNHARVTAAAGAALGLGVVLVLNLNGRDAAEPATPTGNTRLDRLFGADIRFVATRDDRDPAMARIADELRAAGRRPFVIPLGASTAVGAIGFARAIGELGAAGVRPDAIVHATSSGGTQAGVIAGCALFGVKTRAIGVSADASSGALAATVRAILADIAATLGAKPATVGADQPIEIDDRFVGAGYGVPTPESVAALELVARREGIVLDPTYTAKAMAALLARIRAGEFAAGDTVLFWHTGGTVGVFA